MRMWPINQEIPPGTNITSTYLIKQKIKMQRQTFVVLSMRQFGAVRVTLCPRTLSSVFVQSFVWVVWSWKYLLAVNFVMCQCDGWDGWGRWVEEWVMLAFLIWSLVMHWEPSHETGDQTLHCRIKERSYMYVSGNAKGIRIISLNLIHLLSRIEAGPNPAKRDMMVGTHVGL